MTSLFITDLLLTAGFILGIEIWMKKTGDSFQEVCMKIKEAIFRK